MPKGLMQTLAAAVGGTSKQMSNDENDETNNEEENSMSDDKELPEEGDENQDNKNSEEDEDAPADDEEDNSAKNAAQNATKVERARCLSILTHPNADANGALAAKLLTDGTAASQAVSLLDVVGGGGSHSASSLSAKVLAAQGNKRPGQDNKAAKSGSNILSMNDRLLAKNQTLSGGK